MVTGAGSERGPAAAAASPARFTFSPQDDFAAALRAAANAHPGRDIIVLAPGTRLPFALDERLGKAAYAAPEIAAAVPMCDVSPLYALVDEARQPVPAADAELIDRSAYCMGLRAYYEVPRIHPVCAYLRRDALDEFLASDSSAGTAQEVLDRFMSACEVRGRVGVLCDYVYVSLEGEAPAGAAGIRGSVAERAFVQQNPLGALRRAVNEGLHEGLPPVSTPGLDARPVQLHVMHFWGGGLDRWVRDFGRADPSRVNLILATYRIGENGGQRIVLYSDPSAMIPVRTWDIARPIRSSAVASLEYRAILGQVIEEFDVEAIIASSLIGHSLDALDTPLRTIVVCHDYYPVCQAINPQFRGTCQRCTLEDLRECAGSNPLNSIFTDRSSDEWHAMRTRFTDLVLARGIEMVVPSESVATTIRRLDPRLAAAKIHVIPHGMDMDVAKLSYPKRAPGERLRIVVLGRLSPQKGTALLRAASSGLNELADITLVGGGGNGLKLAAECGWKCIERYELEELACLLGGISPHAVLLASVVPETFSYTLSECWALGIPPVATALGSFKERIAEGETGFVFEPNVDSLLEALRRLQNDPGLLDRVAATLASRPRGRTTVDMARDYDALVPLAPRPVARFRVGIGRHTALTEPYRHLSRAYYEVMDAYGQVNDALVQSSKAIEDTNAAYGQVRADRDRLAGLLNELLGGLEALRLRRHFWRATKAARLVEELRTRMYPEKGQE